MSDRNMFFELFFLSKNNIVSTIVFFLTTTVPDFKKEKSDQNMFFS